MLIATICASIAIAIGVVRMIAARRWLRIVVTGNSMAPTFCDGQLLLVRRRGDRVPRVGDAIVFEAPPNRRQELVLRLKRVAAVGGDALPRWARTRLDEAHVPIGHVVVAGDNAHSEDSRQLGFVAVRSILGIVDESGTPHRAAMLPARRDATN